MQESCWKCPPLGWATNYVRYCTHDHYERNRMSTLVLKSSTPIPKIHNDNLHDSQLLSERTNSRANPKIKYFHGVRSSHNRDTYLILVWIFALLNLQRQGIVGTLTNLSPLWHASHTRNTIHALCGIIHSFVHIGLGISLIPHALGPTFKLKLNVHKIRKDPTSKFKRVDGKIWTMFHGLPKLSSNPPPRNRPNIKSNIPYPNRGP